MKKKICTISLIIVLILSSFAPTYAEVTETSRDIIEDFKALLGVDETAFRMDEQVTRQEFITMLSLLFKWTENHPDTGSFQDNQDSSQWYYNPIETALSLGVIDTASSFRREDIITREEITVMIIRALGLKNIAEIFEEAKTDFEDIKDYKGYIMIAHDLNIIHGTTTKTFNPMGRATREEAMAMLMRAHLIDSKSIKKLHGYYSLRNLSRLNRINVLDSISYVKKELTYKPDTHAIELIDPPTTDENVSSDILKKFNSYSADTKTPQYLTVHGILDLQAFLDDEDAKNDALNQLGKILVNTAEDSLQYDGLILDFQQITLESKDGYFQYLESISAIMKTLHKDFYITLRWPGYYTSQDFKRMESLANNIVVIFSDPLDKTTSPFLPTSELYNALKVLTNEHTGFTDKTKLIIQIAPTTCQWQTDEDTLVNEQPLNPSYDALYEVLQTYDVAIDKISGNARATYKDDRGLTNHIWFQDKESMDYQIKLLTLFGIQHIALEDASIIPNYTWKDVESNSTLNIWDSVLGQVVTPLPSPVIEKPPVPEDNETTEQPIIQEETNKTITLDTHLTAKTAILMDAKTGDILYEKQINSKRNPASMTKIMMMYIIMEGIHSGELSWDDQIIASANAANTPGKDIRIETGDTFNLKTLFTSMVVESGCDATVALAEYLEGSEKAYVIRANARAKEMGLTNTHFVNSHGLYKPGHYSTAKDIATLTMKLITAYPEILDISSIIQQKTYRKRYGIDTMYRLDTTNDLLTTYKWATGLKTGFHDQAGYCLCATAEKNGQHLISVVMGSVSDSKRVEESQILLEAGFNQ